jgi:hypothetical protein
VDKDGQCGVVITWKIAEAGGIQTQKQDAKSADDLLAMQMCSFSLHWVATPLLAVYCLS